jgi:hypothetical protein
VTRLPGFWPYLPDLRATIFHRPFLGHQRALMVVHKNMFRTGFEITEKTVF